MSGGGHADLPALALELIVGVIAHGAQNHGQGLIAVDGLVGVEVGAVAQNQLCVGAVADVASGPVVLRHVLELGVVLVNTRLGIVHIAGDDAVDDGGNFSPGNGLLGGEVGAIVDPLEHLQVGQNGDGLVILGVDVLVVVEGVGNGHEGQGHDQSQGQRENLLQISHVGLPPIRMLFWELPSRLSPYLTGQTGPINCFFQFPPPRR